jgi:chitodextrinase
VVSAISGLLLAACVEQAQNNPDSVNDPNPEPIRLADAVAPSVSIVSPFENDVLLGVVTVTAHADDNVGVSGVQFKLDGTNLGAEDTAAPYNIAWNTTQANNGSHVLDAVARDTAGNSATATIIVTVSNLSDAQAPTVPANLSASAVSSSQINLTWSASTDNVGVTGYRVYRNGTQIGTTVATSYSDSGLTSSTTYSYTVAAQDATGNISAQSSPALGTTPAVDTTPPTVSFTNPANNATISGSVTVTATASDNFGVIGVQFKLDGANLGAEDTAAPYSVSWNTATATNASHTLSAVARDAAGNSSTTTISVTVSNVLPDTQAPTVPANLSASAVSSSQINLTWSASTDNVGVTGYKVYRNGTQVATRATTSYSDAGLNSGSTYSYSVSAYDAAGNESAQSTAVLGTTPAVDTTPPTVSFANPANNDTVTGNVTITANAGDNIGVVGVQFKLDGVNLGVEDTAAPYSVSWNTATATNASHTLSAVARDAAGNSSTTTISVTVSNVLPDTQAPTVPTNLAATPVSSSQINLTWSTSTDNVGVTGYRVYRNGTQIGTTATTSYSDSGLASSTTYSYTVAAYDAAGNVSAQTGAASATTTASGKRYSTNFDLTESPISEGGKWTNIGLDWTAVVTSGGIAYGTHRATGYNDSYAALSGFAADHSVEGTIFITGSFSYNQEVELLLRWAQSAHVARGYEILWNANNTYAYIVRWNGALGDFTILKRIEFPRAPVTGDVMKAQIAGSLITVYLNGVLVGSHSDSTWATGDPGIGFYSDDPSGAQNSRFGFTSFTATD